MKSIQIVFFVFSVYGILVSCNRSNSSAYPYEKTETELRIELEDQELNSPLEYITGGELNMKHHKKEFRNGGIFRKAEYEPDGATVSGHLRNTATLATFKDVNITLSFFSATGTKISEQSYTIYKFLKPGQTIPISLRLASVPSAMHSFSYKINNASPVY